MGWKGPVTHRQFVAWLAWEEVSWWEHSLSDRYLQLIATEARKCWVADPNSITMDHMQLREQGELEDEEVVPLGALGSAGRFLHRIVDKDGNVISETMVVRDGRNRDRPTGNPTPSGPSTSGQGIAANAERGR